MRIPLAIRGGFDKKKLPSRSESSENIQRNKLGFVEIILCGRAGACSRPTCTRLILCVGAIHESPVDFDVILRNNTEVVPYES